jgi:hypothetical protein
MQAEKALAGASLKFILAGGLPKSIIFDSSVAKKQSLNNL